MYPPHSYWAHHCWRRGPSRLLWFTLGAITTALWIKHKEMHNQGRYWGNCRRAPIQVPQNFPNNPPIPPQSMAPNGYYPNRPGLWASGQQDFDEQFERDKQKLLALGRQAQNVMSDLSESTLDALIATVESLKVKLAERKEQQKQAETVGKPVDPQRERPPSRWV